MSKSDYEEFATEVKDKPKEYILTYYFSPKKGFKAEVDKISKKLGLEVINMNSPTGKFSKCTPNEFIDLLMHAKLVCTSSFHGQALSVALDTPFISFPSYAKASSRIKTLLRITKLENRMLGTVKEEEYFALHTDKENLQKIRDESLQFLTESLREAEKK